MEQPNGIQNGVELNSPSRPRIGSSARFAENSGQRLLQTHPDREGGHLSFIPAASVGGLRAWHDPSIQNTLKDFRSRSCSGNLQGSLNDLTRNNEMNENWKEPEQRAKLGTHTGSYSSAAVVGGQFTPDRACDAERKPSPIETAMRLIEADSAHRSLAADQVLMLRMVMPSLSVGLRQLQQGINKWMNHQGFWSRNITTAEVGRMEKSEKIALIHTEVSELLEGVREGKGRGNEGEECADIVIRVLDYCEEYDLDIAKYIETKMYRNYQRPFKHGKEF